MAAAIGMVIVTLTLQGTAIALLLFAGHLYVRGAMERSRLIARRAGLTAAAGAMAAAGTLAFARGEAHGAAASRSWIATLFLVAAGVAALLGGLSGKPRPAGEMAALLWVAALVALVGGW